MAIQVEKGRKPEKGKTNQTYFWLVYLVLIGVIMSFIYIMG